MIEAIVYMVCLCVCRCVSTYSRTTGTKPTALARQALEKLCGDFAEKPASSRTTLRDPAHQL